MYEKALLSFEVGDYRKAHSTLKSLVINYPNWEKLDYAQFYLGETLLKLKRFDEAVSEYSFILENIPYSPLRDKAKLKIAECYFLKSPNAELDQEDLTKALEILKELKQNPNSGTLKDSILYLEGKIKDKLAQKELNQILVYRNLGLYEQQKFYLDVFLKEHKDTHYYWEALYYLADYYINTSRWDSAHSIIHYIINNLDKNDKYHELVRKTKILGLKYNLWPFKKGGVK